MNKKIWIIILTIWTLIGITVFFKNTTNLIIKHKDNYFLDNYSFRKVTYGDLFDLSTELARINHKEPFVIVTNEGWDFFLLRYLIYPKKITWIKNIDVKEINSFPTVVIKSEYNKVTKYKIIRTNNTKK